MAKEFLSPLLFALFWATLGCIWVRYKWRASYDSLCVLWLMTVFGFSLLNMAFFFAWVAWPANVLLSATAAIAPSIAFFGYVRSANQSDLWEQKWGRFAYGGLLIGSAVGVTLYSRIFLEDLLRISNRSMGAVELASFLFIVLVIGISGVAATIEKA